MIQRVRVFRNGIDAFYGDNTWLESCKPDNAPAFGR